MSPHLTPHNANLPQPNLAHPKSTTPLLFLHPSHLSLNDHHLQLPPTLVVGQQLPLPPCRRPATDPSLPSPYSPLPPSLLTTTPFPGCCRQPAAAGRPPTPSHPPCSSPLTSQQPQPQPLPLSPRATVRGSCSLPSFFCFIYCLYHSLHFIFICFWWCYFRSWNEINCWMKCLVRKICINV